MEQSLADLVKEYYDKRGLVWPNFDDAMKFVITELGEIYELDLARKTYVRNHPENKRNYSKTRMAEELGDAIFMLIVTGIIEGVDPLDALRAKMRRKLSKVVTGVSSVIPVTDEEAERIFNEVENGN